MNNNIQRFSIPAITLLLVQACFSQPETGWIEYYNEGNYWDIYACANGDLAVCGQTNFAAARISNIGNELWRVHAGNGRANSIIEADNGDLVIGGSLNSHFIVQRLNENGEQVWLREYGSGECYGVIELKDGRFAIAGYSTNPTLARVMIVNGVGEQEWDRTFDYETNPWFLSLREAEQGLVLVGLYISQRHTYPWMMKVDFQGNRVWAEQYEHNFEMGLINNAMVSAGDGGFAFLGVTSWQEGHPVIVKTDDHGRLQWYRSYENLTTNIYGAITRLPEVGFLITAACWELPERPIAICVDQEGEEIWQQTYESAVDDDFDPLRFHGAVLSNNNRLYAAGLGASRERMSSGAIVACLGNMSPWPSFLRWSPYDTLLTVLNSDSIQFSVSARDAFGRDLSYQWWVTDTLTDDIDTTHTVTFDSSGIVNVECRVVADQWTVGINWHVTVTDFFIAFYTPDTLALMLRRGASQEFAIDSVAAVEGDPVEYQWTVTDLNSQEREDAGTDAGATVEFLRSGNYAVEGLAYRGESSDNVVWTVAVRSAILDFWPRELSLSVSPDSLVGFEVWPFNAESDSLTYRWEVDGDSVGGEAVMEWSFAPKDSGQAGRSTYAVSAIVMDGAEGDTVAWTVSVRDPNSTPPTPPSMDGGENPVTFGFVSVSPNPFNSTTTIRFSTTGGDARSTRLTLHDLTGRQVLECMRASVRAGEHSYVLNGADLPAGIYWVRLEAGGRRRIAKVVMVR